MTLWFPRPHAAPTEGITGEEILELFPKARSIISADGHDPSSWYFAAGDFGTRKVVLAISVCANCHGARTAKRYCSDTPDVFSGGAELWVSRQPTSARESPGIPLWGMRQPVRECWIDGLYCLHLFRLHKHASSFLRTRWIRPSFQISWISPVFMTR